MKQLLILLIALFVSASFAEAQRYYTKNGHVAFFSKTSIENIKAANNQVITVLNTQTGELQLSLLIRNFHFEKALMEEHFNEDYLESDKFPKAGFRGNISNLNDVNFGKDGLYSVTVSGHLEIHGVTKKLSVPGTVAINGGVISVNSKFFIRLSDYNIAIPRPVMDNIAESVELSVLSNLDQKL